MNLATVQVGGAVACGPVIARTGPIATIRQDGRTVTGPVVRKGGKQ